MKRKSSGRSRFGRFKIIPYKNTHAIIRDGSYYPVEIGKRKKLLTSVLVHMARDEYGGKCFV